MLEPKRNGPHHILEQLSNDILKSENLNPISLNNCTHLVEFRENEH